MSNVRWFDCRGAELHEGDKIRDIDTGKVELVYACHPAGRPNELSLGINASNEKFLEHHPEFSREIYPFSGLFYQIVGGQRRLVCYEKVV